MTGHDDAGAARPRNAIGRTAKLVMDTLAAEGFGTQPRAWEELWNLTITGMRHAWSCLIVAGNGYLRWDYEPDSGPETSPAGIATMIMRLLGATDPGERPPDDGMYRAFLVKGAAGRMLKDQGLKVELLSYQDLESFDVVAEIQVINPGSPGRGKVRVTDNGDIEWECHAHQAFGSDAAAIVAVIAPILRQGLHPRMPA
jgi:hypothetical protein